MASNLQIVEITASKLLDIRHPIAFLFSLRLLMRGKHSRVVLSACGLLLGLLSANLVLMRVAILISTPSSDILPSGRISSSSQIWFGTLGVAVSDPIFGELIGSMMDRVDEGDRRPEACGKAISVREEAEGFLLSQVLGAQ